jgi:uncharacterized FlaG/YvyC family protein
MLAAAAVLHMLAAQRELVEQVAAVTAVQAQVLQQVRQIPEAAAVELLREIHQALAVQA